MSNNKIIENIRTFVDQEGQKGKKITIFKRSSTPSNYFKEFDIKVELDNCKEIILQEETKIELGGESKKSFSIVYPISDLKYVKDGDIILIGPEIEDISDRNLDFGMFILIGGTRISEKDKDNLRRFNFISNGIEGFMIRTIPRRFWCRISDDVIKKNFSFL